jgi:hypothetical protein
MKNMKWTTAGTALLVGCGLILVAGCQTFHVAVTLDAEGGGTRTLELTTDGNWDEDGGVSSVEELRQLFGLAEARGWARVETGEKSGEGGGLRFRRSATIPDLASWHGHNGDLQVRGTLEEGPLSDVRFSNAIAIETGTGSAARFFGYRETFSWEMLREVILSGMSEHFCSAVKGAYPHLAETEMAELQGLISGLFLFVLELEVRDADLQHLDEMLTAAISTHALEILRRGAPDADDDRVTMPGRIVETNADETEGNTAIWEFELWDAILRPAEIHVRSEIPF